MSQGNEELREPTTDAGEAGGGKRAKTPARKAAPKKAEKLAKPEKAEKPARKAAPKKAEKPAKPEKAEKPAKPAKPEKAEKPARTPAARKPKAAGEEQRPAAKRPAQPRPALEVEEEEALLPAGEGEELAPEEGRSGDDLDAVGDLEGASEDLTASGSEVATTSEDNLEYAGGEEEEPLAAFGSEDTVTAPAEEEEDEEEDDDLSPLARSISRPTYADEEEEEEDEEDEEGDEDEEEDDEEEEEDEEDEEGDEDEDGRRKRKRKRKGKGKATAAAPRPVVRRPVAPVVRRPPPTPALVDPAAAPAPEPAGEASGAAGGGGEEARGRPRFRRRMAPPASPEEAARKLMEKPNVVNALNWLRVADDTPPDLLKELQRKLENHLWFKEQDVNAKIDLERALKRAEKLLGVDY